MAPAESLRTWVALEAVRDELHGSQDAALAIAEEGHASTWWSSRAILTEDAQTTKDPLWAGNRNATPSTQYFCRRIQNNPGLLGEPEWAKPLS